MERRRFIKIAGLSAIAISTTGFKLIEENGIITTNCATSRDMLGPFFRKNAPLRNDLTYVNNQSEIELKVIGQVFGTDCTKPLQSVEIDIWHCDHEKKYDMESDEYKCRGKIFTNENGEYWYKTFVPPPYQGRPKHIHYLIHESKTHQELVTQLYFKGDKKIKKNNWVKYRWDEKRILDVYQNSEGIAEVKLDLFLKGK